MNVRIRDNMSLISAFQEQLTCDGHHGVTCSELS